MDYRPLYETWSVDVEGDEFEVLLDLGHAEDFPLADHQWCFGVRVPMAKVGPNGPDETERNRLDAVENRIRALLKTRDALYVGRRTGAEIRDLMFYMESRPRMVEDRIRASIGSEIRFMSRPDPEWEGYQSMLPGDAEFRQIEDRRTINGLINADADTSKMHRVEHRVTVGIVKGAEALERFFTKLGLIDIATEGKLPELTVVGVQETSLDVPTIHKISWMIESKAPQARGTYKGWTATPELLDYDDLPETGLGDDLDSMLAALMGGGDDD